MIHPWQTASAHGSTTDVSHTRYTLVQLVHSLVPRLSTCIPASDVVTNYWYDVIYIVTVYISQGYRPEWEQCGDCLHPCHVLWEVLCRTHAGRGEDSQQCWKYCCPWAGTYLQHGSWWRHSWVLILGLNTGFLFQVFKFLQIYKSQNGKFGLEGTVFLISRCYITSPAYKAILDEFVAICIVISEQ